MPKCLILILCITIIMSALLISCQNSSGDITDTSSSSNNASAEQSPDATTSTNDLSDDLPSKYIAVRSVSELERMREMLLCNDESILNEYLISVEGGGAESKEDLAAFVKLSDSIPYVKLIDGEITFISYTSINTSSVLSVTVQADNGEWIRFEYITSVKNVTNELQIKKDSLGDKSLISSPVFNADKTIAFYTETNEAHPSGKGNIVQWTASINGIYTNIVYYVLDVKSVNTENILKDAEITSISTQN